MSMGSRGQKHFRRRSVWPLDLWVENEVLFLLGLQKGCWTVTWPSPPPIIISLNCFILIPPYSYLLRASYWKAVRLVLWPRYANNTSFRCGMKPIGTEVEMLWNEIDLGVFLISSCSGCRFILNFHISLHCFCVHVCINTANSKMRVWISSHSI